MTEQKETEPEIILVDNNDATEYSIGYSIDDGEAQIAFHNENGILSNFLMTSDECYQLAQRLLRAYDKLEGL